MTLEVLKRLVHPVSVMKTIGFHRLIPVSTCGTKKAPPRKIQEPINPNQNKTFDEGLWGETAEGYLWSVPVKPTGDQDRTSRLFPRLAVPSSPWMLIAAARERCWVSISQTGWFLSGSAMFYIPARYFSLFSERGLRLGISWD